MAGSTGSGGPSPPLGNAPGIFDTSPLDPSNRFIIAQLIVEDPHRWAVLRSPNGDRIVRPMARSSGGLFVFVVGEQTHWLLTVTDSDVVDLPISANQDVTIVLP